MHLLSFLLYAGASAAAVLTTPSLHDIHHVVHEKRHSIPTGWAKRAKLHEDFVLPLRIGLTQRNLERSCEFLDSVSNPASDTYGQHWSADQVADAFAPSEETIAMVMAWLTDFGFSRSRLSLSRSKVWITVNATVAEAEALLQTRYHVYEHTFGQSHIACESYSVPSHLSGSHVDLIMPTVHFDVKLKRGGHDVGRTPWKRQNTGAVTLSRGRHGGSGPRRGPRVGPSNIIKELKNCDTMITPDCLRALYGIEASRSPAPGNSYGIVEYTPEAFLPGDMDMFFKMFSPTMVGQRPIFDSIDGGVVQQTSQSFLLDGESDLDLQYGMTLVYPQEVTLYQVGDLVESASFNNFLDGIDGSYCTFEGGDDPTGDSIYPDPDPAGFQGQSCGIFKPANVISTSYGFDEAALSPAYVIRQCNEYLKLGLQGVSVLYSSGDSGVAGNQGQCISPNGTFNDGNSGRFNPDFPATCPYVTAVGATQVPNGTDIVAALATGTQPETACETVIFSGGGFSNVFPMPSYQASAVSRYLAENPPPYGPDQFNNSGTVRAFPDVSANGANYVVAIDGNFSLVFGTSASSPTFGSIITLINDHRLKQGKKSVGFLNPVLYANPHVLKDVTQGGNQGCGTPGFQSAPGWDPVTGLGTPIFSKMLSLFLRLP